MRPGLRRCGLALLLLLAGPARAEERTLTLDPDRTRVQFTLAATLHTVEGTLRLLAGELRFDLETGAAGGVARIDARSAETGIEVRDRRMHQEVLESARFPEIALRLERVRGAPPRVTVRGRLALKGAEHPVELPVEVEVEGLRARLRTRFQVPYVEWGLKDVSTFLLRVAPVVGVEVDAEGSLDAPLERPVEEGADVGEDARVDVVLRLARLAQAGPGHAERVVARLHHAELVRRPHPPAHRSEQVERAQPVAGALHEQDRSLELAQHLVAQGGAGPRAAERVPHTH